MGDLEVGHRSPLAEHVAEQRPQLRNVQRMLAELVHEPADGRLGRDLKGLVEGAVRRLDRQIAIQHQQRLAHRVHDRLGIQAGFLEGVGGDVREGDHDAHDPVVVGSIGQDLPDEPASTSILHFSLIAPRSASTIFASRRRSASVDSEATSPIGRPTAAGVKSKRRMGANRRTRKRVSRKTVVIAAGQQIVEVVVRLLQLEHLVFELGVDGG